MYKLTTLAVMGDPMAVLFDVVFNVLGYRARATTTKEKMVM